MAGPAVVTYECTLCGKKFSRSDARKVPVYCCGTKTTPVKTPVASREKAKKKRP